jgi:hypothetical protein
MTDSEILFAAADLIERVGLCRNEMWPGWGVDKNLSYTSGSPCCLWGAISVVMECHPINQSVFDVLYRLDQFIGENSVKWSDATERDEVTTLLRHAAREWA